MTEALEQQTATSEILRVIAASPTDLQPVFDAIVQNAVRLVSGQKSVLFRLIAGEAHVVAQSGLSGDGLATFQSLYPGPLTDHRATELGRRLAQSQGYRAVLFVLLLQGEIVIGVLSVSKSGPLPFAESQIALLQTFADQTVIAIENVRLFNETKEALEQQTATADILRVISQSPTELQPVLDALVKSAVRFCGADDSLIHRLEGDCLPCVAHHRPIPAQLGHVAPVVWTTAGRCVLERRAIHVADLQTETEEFPEGSAIAREFSYHTILSVPLLREGVPLGAIILRRAAVEPFSDKQIALLHTFADRAVIAIENVRLFMELEARNRDLIEALEQQTATSEILRVISASPTDVEPVFHAIVSSGRRLCDASHCLLVGFDGEMLSLLATDNLTAEGGEAVRRAFPYRASRVGISGRVVLDRRVVHIADVTEDPEYGFKDVAWTAHTRAQLDVPMFRGNEIIGVLVAARAEPSPFTPAQVDLLQTFADQAVIAIENVRLFRELEARNRDLTNALEQQTATAEILRVIGSSPTEVQPVFDAIVTSAVRLLGAFSSTVFRLIDDEVSLVAYTSTGSAGDATIRHLFPRPRANSPAHARVVRDGAPYAVRDIETAQDMPDEWHEVARARGFRSGVTVPMLRGRAVIGMITVTRRELGAFTDDHIALLQTFADQAVIAIENVRLFKELLARADEVIQ